MRPTQRLVGLLIVMLLLASCGGAAGTPADSVPPARGQPALQDVIAAARKEGALSFVWGAGTLKAPEGVKQLGDALNKRYGLNLNIQFTPGPSMSQMAAQIAQEYKTGKPSTTDVEIGYADHVVPLMEADALEAVDWLAWAPNIKNAEMIAGAGRAVTFETTTPGLTYNTRDLKGNSVPRSLQDLLKPEYKGHIAIQQFGNPFQYLALPEFWGEAKVMAYVKQLVPQSAGLMRCTDETRIASGEFDILAESCSQSSTLRLKATGAPVDFVIPSDAVFLNQLYLSIPKNSTHPNAAKLWVDFLMSREGQDIIYGLEFADSTFVPGSKTVKDIDALKAAGSQLAQIDVALFQKEGAKKLEDMTAAIQRAIH
jgi:iron(III) transport system substrate-binding protein